MIRPKFNTHKKISFRSLKDYSPDLFENCLKGIDFPNYENFTDIDAAYSDFMDKLMSAIESIAPIKEKRIKNNSQEWFDGEIIEKIALRNKCLKKFKKTKLQIDKEIYNQSSNEVQNLIRTKKRMQFEEKLKESIGKPKELWKNLRSLGLPNKTSSASKICIDKNANITFDPRSNAEIFKNFFSNLAQNLLVKLPAAPLKFGMSSSFCLL